MKKILLHGIFLLIICITAFYSCDEKCCDYSYNKPEDTTKITDEIVSVSRDSLEKLLLFYNAFNGSNYSLDPGKSGSYIPIGKDSLQHLLDIYSLFKDKLFVFKVMPIDIKANSAFKDNKLLFEKAKITAIQNNVVKILNVGIDGYSAFTFTEGLVTVNIICDGYLNVDFDALIQKGSAKSGNKVNDIIAGTVIPMVGLDTTKQARLKGQVTLETNLINNLAEKAEGIAVSATLDFKNEKFQKIISNANKINSNAKISRIDYRYNSNITILSVFTDLNGMYEIKIPFDMTEFPIKIEVPDFARDQLLLTNKLNGGYVQGVQQIRTIFSSDIADCGFQGTEKPSVIPIVPPVYVEFSDPETDVNSIKLPVATTEISNGKLVSVNMISYGTPGYNYSVKLVTAPNSKYTKSATIHKQNNDSTFTIVIDDQGEGYDAKPSIIFSASFQKASGLPVCERDGKIKGVRFDDPAGTYTNLTRGIGYIKPPKITFIPAITGIGKDASAMAVLNFDGSVKEVVMLIEGSGYIAKNNIDNITYDGTNASDNQANTGKGFTVYSYSDESKTNPDATCLNNGFLIEQGKTYYKDIYLGTGLRNNDLSDSTISQTDTIIKKSWKK